MMQRMAVIGMGQMGSGMAGRLQEAGHDVIGYDIDPAACRRLAEGGFKMAASIAAAVEVRDIVMSSLPDSRAVRAAWLGADGIVAHAARGTLCVELSTIDPATMREVGAAAASRQLRVIDCPVSGSPKEARAGKLVLIAGGDAEVIEQASAILRLLGDPSKHTGAVGTAKVVKIVNNMMSMANVLVAAEAFALGVAAGVDQQTLFDVLSVSGGRSHHFLKRFPNALNGDFAPVFKIELGEKDLALGIELGRSMKQPTPVASTVRELYALGLAEGLRGQDIVALLKLYRKWAEAGGMV
jgi:3-hydroxyisobutyrate dehydrogenase